MALAAAAVAAVLEGTSPQQIFLLSVETVTGSMSVLVVPGQHSISTVSPITTLALRAVRQCLTVTLPSVAVAVVDTAMPPSMASQHLESMNCSLAAQVVVLERAATAHTQCRAVLLSAPTLVSLVHHRGTRAATVFIGTRTQSPTGRPALVVGVQTRLVPLQLALLEETVVGVCQTPSAVARLTMLAVEVDRVITEPVELVAQEEAEQGPLVAEPLAHPEPRTPEVGAAVTLARQMDQLFLLVVPVLSSSGI